MKFEELLDEACESAHLPDLARIQLPSALSEKTKKMAIKISSDELGFILATVIDEINRGSVETVDSLVRKKLRIRVKKAD